MLGIAAHDGRVETTVAGAIESGRDALRAFGADGRFDALRLLEEVLGRDSAWIFAHGDDAVDDERAVAYRAALARRAAGEPVAYIVGTVGFYGRTFAVSPAVLVPRPETELLVRIACEAFAEMPTHAPYACDIGTGSGIIAITLACEIASARVLAIDISPDALDIARRNALALGVDDRIEFRCGDGASVLAGQTDRFDAVLANLPYIRSGDLEPMPCGLRYEPRIALDGGNDGLALYEPLLDRLRERLAPGGFALFEAGADTTEALAERAAQAIGPGSCVHVHRDYGGHARIVDVRLEREAFSSLPKPSRP